MRQRNDRRGSSQDRDVPGRVGRTDFAEDLLRISEEVKASRKAAKLEKAKQRKRQVRGAQGVTGFKDGRIRIGLRWVDPEPYLGEPLEVRPENGAKWFSIRGSRG